MEPNAHPAMLVIQRPEPLVTEFESPACRERRPRCSRRLALKAHLRS